MMTKFKYGGIENKKVYLDQTVYNMCLSHRRMFGQLIAALVAKGDTVRARKALDYCNKVIPASTVRHDYFSTILAESYYKIGEPAKANAIMNAVATDCVEYLNWYFSLNPAQINSVTDRIGNKIAILGQVLRVCDNEKQKSIMDKFVPKYMEYTSKVKMR